MLFLYVCESVYQLLNSWINLQEAWRVSKSKLKLLYDWQSVSQSVSLGVGHPVEAHDQILIFPFVCRKIDLLFVLGRPLWREDGPVICSAICQWSESRRTRNHTLLSHLRLLGSLSVASYDSQGLRWKYSYPPPHGHWSVSWKQSPYQRRI
jgi:hypothetical protein